MKLSKVQELSSMSLYFRKMPVTPEIRIMIQNRFQLKVYKKFTNQPESLRLKKILKVTTKLNCLCQPVSKEDNKTCLDGKKASGFEKAF